MLDYSGDLNTFLYLYDAVFWRFLLKALNKKSAPPGATGFS